MKYNSNRNTERSGETKLEHLAKVIYARAYRCMSVKDSMDVAASVNINVPHSVYVETSPLRFMERILLHQTEDLTSTGRTIFGKIVFGEADEETILSGSFVDPHKKAACIVTRESKTFGRIAEDIVIYCPSR